MPAEQCEGLVYYWEDEGGGNATLLSRQCKRKVLDFDMCWTHRKRENDNRQDWDDPYADHTNPYP